MTRLRKAARAFRLSLVATGPDVFRADAAFASRCALNPNDVVVVVPAREGEVIALQISDSSLPGPAVVMLEPASAREFAAAILNAADAADGTIPLNFVPAGVTAPEPPQRSGAGA